VTEPARRLTLGIIGHVDHGKTSLVRALTGMETDRLPEEQRRGISIALGFAHLALPAGEIDIIDMPGHERFVRTMISGATGVDAVLLVVAANEGIMPQTREHVDIAGLLGIRQAVVAVTKADLATADRCAAVGAEAALLAESAGMRVAGAPVSVAITDASGLPALRDAIVVALAEAIAPEDSGFAYLPVDRAFSLAGYGTVVTGTLRRGVLRTDDEIEAVPNGRRLRIRGLQIHGGKVAEARPGQRVAVNLRGVEPSELPRGTALATPYLLPPSGWISVTLRAVADAPALQTGMRLQLLFGTAEVEARLRLLDRDALDAGQVAFAQLRTATPIAAPAREKFVLRLPSPALTVAGGAVLDPDTRRQRRHAPGVLTWLRALADTPPEQIVVNETTRAGAQGIAVARLARLAGIAPSRVVAALRAQPAVLVARERVAVPAAAFDDTLAKLRNVLASHPDGLGRDALLDLLPKVSAVVLDDAIARLVAGGALRQAGGVVRVADAARERDQARAQDSAAAQLAEELRKAGLTPPEPWKLAPDPPRRRLLDRLIKEGIAVRALDRVQKRELVFHREAIESAQRVLAPRLGGTGLLVSEAGAALGISRKFCVPLLEHLDEIRFTRRVADRRVLAQSR